MRCPFCDQTGKGRVVDTRSGEEGETIRRRRECLFCHNRWSTLERVETADLSATGTAQPKPEPPVMEIPAEVRPEPSKKMQALELIERLRAAQRMAKVS